MIRDYENANFEKTKINYPPYQTTNRYKTLYGDIRTWVREVIQNADDANATHISINIDYPNKVVIINDGDIFNEKDIQRLLTPCLGGKDIYQTGAMNIGALSVLSISDEPLYHSGNILLKFHMDHKKKDFVPYIVRDYEKEFRGTKIKLPFHDRLKKDDEKKLRNIYQYLITHSHLLFTHNLESIKLTYPDKTYYLEKNVEEPKILDSPRGKFQINKISIEKKSTEQKENKDEKESSKWLICQKNVRIPQKYHEVLDIKQDGKRIVFPVNLAFKLKEGQLDRVDYPIYIVFPSETAFGLGFVLSSNFIPETSRKGMITEGTKGEFNRFLLKKSAILLENMLKYFKEQMDGLSSAKKRKAFQNLLKTLHFQKIFNSFEPYIRKYIYFKILNYLSSHFLANDGNWYKTNNLAITSQGLMSFFNKKYKFIEKTNNENLNKLFKDLKIKFLENEDLVIKLAKNKFEDHAIYIKAWEHLAKNQEEINARLRNILKINRTLKNKNDEYISFRKAVIPDKSAVGLSNPNQEVYSDLIKNTQVRLFLQNMGVPEISSSEIFQYFLSIRKAELQANIPRLKKYYQYFHQHNILDESQALVLTTKGFRKPKNSFFSNERLHSILGKDIPFVINELEKDKVTKLYLKSLGVNNELTISYAISYIKKQGESAINQEMLWFLANNSHQLKQSDIDFLRKIKLIPTEKGLKKPSQCYFLNEKNQVIFEDQVSYFNPNRRKIDEWARLFSKVGMAKKPRLKDLKKVLPKVIEKYPNKINNISRYDKILNRMNLIFEAINDTEESDAYLASLQEVACMPTQNGIKKPKNVYIKQNKLYNLLGDSVNYCQINLPSQVIQKLGINETPLQKDVALYFFNSLIDEYKKVIYELGKERYIKKLDKIYTFFGQEKNFNKLSPTFQKQLYQESIIYLPRENAFFKPNKIAIKSKEAELIYENDRHYLGPYTYPNSFSFFRKLGMVTSIDTDNIAKFLIEYVDLSKINIKRLFKLYHLLGQRFSYISENIKIQLKESPIVIGKDLKSLHKPTNIFIPDNKEIVEAFDNLPIVPVKDKILKFFEKLEIRKVSEVTSEEIIFEGKSERDNQTTDIAKKIEQIIPYLNVIIKQSNLFIYSNWKKKLAQVECIRCSQIRKIIRFKTHQKKIPINDIEYDKNANKIGIPGSLILHGNEDFIISLAKALVKIIFRDKEKKSKIIIPFIEKLIKTQNPIPLLKNLGYSTIELEAEELDLGMEDFFITQKPRLKKKENPKLMEDFEDLPPAIWDPKKFKLVKKVKGKKSKTRKSNDKDYVKVYLDKPPATNDLLKIIKDRIDTTFSNTNEIQRNQFTISPNILKKLRQISERKIKNMEFPAKVKYGGFDIQPTIPELELKSKWRFSYYIQKGLDISIDTSILKNFERMLKIIIKIMGGNPDTVKVALFNAPINGFNHQGQLIFNYLFLMKGMDKDNIPLYIIWTMIAAHELAHNIEHRHGQIHSRYSMIFSINALKQLDYIKAKYEQIFA